MAGMKLKVGRLTPKEDIERVRIAREVVGPEFIIACDANQAWTVSQAIEFSRGVQDFGVRWLEEPVRWYDQLRGLSEIRSAGRIPGLCAGQGEISGYGCRDLIASNAIDVLNVDVTIAGGVTEWRRMAGMCRFLNIGMAHHEEPQAALHLLAAVPNGLYVEIFPIPNATRCGLNCRSVIPGLEIGYMLVPQEPGFGIKLRPEVIERYRADDVSASVAV